MYFPAYLLSSIDDVKLICLVGGLLDSMMVFPLAIIILLVMLQDRHRPLWPVALMVAPLVVGMAWAIASRDDAIMPILRLYFLLLSIVLLIYVVCATRQYKLWLRDNYADLEHKEVWQSFVVLAFMFLMLNFYVFGIGYSAYEIVSQVCGGLLICFLLWRVETLSDLSISQGEISQGDRHDVMSATSHACPSPCDVEAIDQSLVSRNYIEPLLKQYCEEPQLYLQHDISIAQLSATIGINRSYLSQYFSSQGMNYNVYINGLRIQHFINLYQESVATHQPVTAQQLAYQSGFRSYSTFSAAFKQNKGMSVTKWMRVSE